MTECHAAEGPLPHLVTEAFRFGQDAVSRPPELGPPVRRVPVGREGIYERELEIPLYGPESAGAEERIANISEEHQAELEPFEAARQESAQGPARWPAPPLA